MKAKEVYKVWYEKGGIWKGWIRPVPFVGINTPQEIREVIDYHLPQILYIDQMDVHTAIVIDNEGIDSIKEGLALAELGYLPIPIFNGTNPNINCQSTTDNRKIESLLIWGALKLKDISLSVNHPPVFLLDSHRLNRYKMNRGIFDNSWDVYPQDLPSYHYLKKNKITKIIVRSNHLNRDLKKILYSYQIHHIDILFTTGYEKPKKIKIKKWEVKYDKIFR